MTTVLCRWLPRIFRWPVVVGWMALIFAGSSIPSEFAPSQSTIPFDKIAHFGEYSVLAFLLVGVSRNYARLRGSFIVIMLCIVCAAAYGASDEFHQRFVPGRDAGVPDWVADAIGATSGGLAGAALLAAIDRLDADGIRRGGSASGRRER